MLEYILFKIKCYWHEGNAFLSALNIYFIGNESEKKAVRGKLFSPKFLLNEYYIKKLKKKKIEITKVGKFWRVRIENNFYHWPSSADIHSLFTVLAEALLSQHPHYYDSGPTIIKKGDKVLDIGACEGAFSIKALQKGASVIAVEPSKVMIEAMELSVRELLLKDIELLPCILGSKNANVGFKEDILSPESSVICELSEASDSRQCWTLDSFVEKYFPGGIDYIKCDAEGADYEILKSGKNILRKFKPKIAVASYHTQYDFRKMKDLLEKIGYTVIGQGLNYSPILHKCYPTLLKAFN